MRSNSADFVVIGAGAVGASVAYEAARRGASVIVLDEGIEVGNGCSYANAGLIAPSHVEPLTTPANVAAGMRHMLRPDGPFHVHPSPRLAPWFTRFAASSGPRRAARLTTRMNELGLRSLQLHGRYAAEGMDTGYRADGVMDVFLTEDGFERAAAKHRGSSMWPERVLTAQEAREREPMLGPNAGAILRPEEAQVGSQQFVTATLKAAQSHGAEIRWGTRARLRPGMGDRIGGVETTDGTITGGTYVVAAGLASQSLCEGVGIRMPMQGAKGYVIDSELDGPGPRAPMLFAELRVVATPYADRMRLCGTLELGSDPKAMSERRLEAIRDAGRRALPEVRYRRTLQTWAGLRPCTADGVPSLGRSEIRRDLVVAAGHGMWGLALGPVSGELVATGVIENAPTLHEPAFTPDRFGRVRGSR